MGFCSFKLLSILYPCRVMLKIREYTTGLSKYIDNYWYLFIVILLYSYSSLLVILDCFIMTYSFCYVIVLALLLCHVSYTVAYSSTLFSPFTHTVWNRGASSTYSSTGYSHCGFILKFIFVIFFSLNLKLILLYSTQRSLSPKKIIMNTVQHSQSSYSQQQR